MKLEFLLLYPWIFSYPILVLHAFLTANDKETYHMIEIDEDSIIKNDRMLAALNDGSSSEYSTIFTTEPSSITVNLNTTILETNTSPESSTVSSESTIAIPLNLLVDRFRHPNRTQEQKIDDLFDLLSRLDQLTTEENSSSTLSPVEIDQFIDSLNSTISRSDHRTYAVVAKPIEQNGTFLIGVYLKAEQDELEVNNDTKESVLNSNFIAGVIVETQSLKDIDFMSVAIFTEPTAYRNLAKTTNDTLVSPVLIMSTKKNNTLRRSKINLYFELLPNQTRYEANHYTCSFYNNSNLRWESTGCSPVRYDSIHNRFECQCDHQTTFALLFLPNVPNSRHLNAQDIASFSALSISIVCFVLVIGHSLVNHMSKPWISVEARDLLPMVSSGTTTLLFILFIGLSVTVYTQQLTDRCSIGSRVLMYFVYFTLILMFCVKTSVGYFNYLRFVRLFPEPSLRRLAIFLVASTFISMICASLAVGFDQNSSINITQVHSGKLCWFTRDVLHYFVTIPIGLFLLANTVMIIWVAKHIFRYVRSVSTSHQLYERRKRCVIVLLSSCLTQGVGWFSGLFLSLMFPSVAIVMSWIFTIFNGFEGLWIIILYSIIRSKKMDRSNRSLATKQLFSKTRNKINAK